MTNRKAIGALLLIFLFLAGAAGGAGGQEDRAQLLARQKQLTAKIEKLTREQDFLLFQKTMCASDSKYLLINAASKTGQLKYRNRVLKDFRFASSAGAGRLKQGMVRVTRKIEESKKRDALLFGDSLVLLGAQAPKEPLARGVPRIRLSKKDFLSVFYAVEIGSLAYVLR